MNDTANLEDGFYWARVGSMWAMTQKIGDKFFTIWDRRTHEEFDEIDPRPIKREDVK